MDSEEGTMIYRVGTGIADVTHRAKGLPMQGMSDPNQKTEGVESTLYSRAFIVEDQSSGKRVVIVSADIWAGTQLVKAHVINNLQRSFGSLYTIRNVLISGTHTHSAPGGFAGYLLYDPIDLKIMEAAKNIVGNVVRPLDEIARRVQEALAGLYPAGQGFRAPETPFIIAEGIAKSIRQAHDNLAPGKVYMATGKVDADCGGNRSLDAYNNNPEAERRGQSNTDKEMLLLKFVHVEHNGVERPIGVLSWYAIHPTDRGQKNKLVCGDNKGYASSLLENDGELLTRLGAKRPFVAAFANANCGDVSGAVDQNGRFTPPAQRTQEGDIQKMRAHGDQQYRAAKSLCEAAKGELRGSVDYRHKHVDMANVHVRGGRTWPAALGLSFAAGSSEDSVPDPDAGLREGIVEGAVTPTERVAQGVMIGVLSALFGIAPENAEFVKGHLPKPIVLRPGLLKGDGLLEPGFASKTVSHPVVPSLLPLQLLKIGNLVITGIPAEITTMAGRRLRNTVLETLKGTGVDSVALAAYANEYSQYITTKEEYEKQHYEGASTLFGPHTLAAYQQEFASLARDLRDPGEPWKKAEGNTIQPGEVLDPGESIRHGGHEFRYQDDGNLVLYQGSNVKWSTDTYYRKIEKIAGVCIMQRDGDLAVYDAFGVRLWHSDTAGNPNSRFVLENSGDAVIGVIRRPDGGLVRKIT
ncbi:MAG TPA: neutral/alkaline non-lysosomal ceramidase N-terminal domain-containing protein [Thermoanaerobaculia bacterium]